MTLYNWNLRENKNKNDSGRLAVPSRLSGLPGRLHISIKYTKYQSIKNTYCSFRFMCRPPERVWKLQFPLFIRCDSEVSAFSSRFRYHMIYFDFKFCEAVFKRQFLEVKQRNKVLFSACTVFRSSRIGILLRCRSNAVSELMMRGKSLQYSFYNAGSSSHADEFGIS